MFLEDAMETTHTILLVETVPDRERALRERGWRVASAASGAQALAVAQAETPALVLACLRLPDMDARTLCHRLKASLPPAGLFFFVEAEEEDLCEVDDEFDDVVERLCPPEILERRLRMALRVLALQQADAKRQIEREAWKAAAAAWLRHEINNPLFAISGSAESLRNRLQILEKAGISEAAELQVRADRILAAAARVHEVVRTFSQPVAFADSPSPRPLP